MGNTLAEYPLHFEDIPEKQHKISNTRKGGKDNKMSKANKVEAPAKVYSKTRGEHFKDIVIAILITSVIAFVAGMSFQGKQHDAIDRAVKAVTPSADAQVQVKK